VVLSLASVLNLSGKTLRLPNGTNLPGTCTVGDAFMDTDAPSGARFYLCEVGNTWVPQGGGGGGGGTTPYAQAVIAAAAMTNFGGL
jgi:hypothetical protein